jgi:ABC-type Fe3+-hydroxamate transport system substrate-binding protein
MVSKRMDLRGFPAWLGVLVSLALLLAACGSSATATPEASVAESMAESMAESAEAEATATPVGERTFDAGSGSVTIEGIPERPYAWGFELIDILSVLGVEPVGFTSRNGGPLPPYLNTDWANAQQLGEPPALEEVVALDPDIILSDASNDNTAVEDIAPVLPVRANSYQDSLDQLLLIGEVFGKEQEAQDFVDMFNQELEDTQAQIADQPAVTSMVVYPGAEPGVLGMWLDSSFTGSLIAALGTDYALKVDELTGTDLEGDNADRATSFGLVQLGLEKIVQLDPDVIFVLGDEQFLTDLGQNPAWNSLSAVTGTRVYLFDRDKWSRARGPVAALEIVKEARHALYPDIFPES